MAALAPTTQAAYRRAVRDFVDWMMEVGEAPATLADLDELLEEYLHIRCIELDGRGKGAAANLVNGLKKLMPESKYVLPRGDSALRHYERLQPKVSYPPLPRHVAITIGVKLSADGHYRMGLGTVVAFTCLLRVSELVGLHTSDVADHRSDPRVDAGTRLMTIRLRRTKTGANKLVVVDDPVVADLLSDAVRRTRSGDLVFPFTAAAYRAAFKSTCAQLSLSAEYVPHSLRHGGATWLSSRGLGVEEILRRGRWASTPSARIYIQSGEAALLATAVPLALAAAGRFFERHLALVFALSQRG